VSATAESRTSGALLTREAMFAVVAAIVMFSLNAVWAREAHANVLGFTAWRMILAIPVLGATVLVTRHRPGTAPRPAHVSLRAVAPGVRVSMVAIGALFGLSALLNFVAINSTTLVDVGVIHSLQPAVVALVAGRLLGEHVDWRLMARCGVAILGAFLVAAASTGQGTWSLHGDMLAVLGLILNSAWFLAGRWVRTRTEVDATDYMLVVFTTAALVVGTIAAVDGNRLHAAWAIVGWAALTAVFGTIGHTLIAWAHRYLAAAVSSLFLLAQPVLIAVLAWIVFGETVDVAQVIGGAIVLGALAGIVTAVPDDPAPVVADVPDLRDDT
jgi:drug/metabolite transporter (DMT)-like permease